MKKGKKKAKVTIVASGDYEASGNTKTQAMKAIDKADRVPGIFMYLPRRIRGVDMKTGRNVRITPKTPKLR